MPVIADYLDITAVQARSQWRSILARPARPNTAGYRQVDFTPVETLLCLAATFVVDHHLYGGSTSQLAPSPVPELAGLFQRTSASILAKQANLDGSRPNGARNEVEVAETLLSDPARLASVYSVVIEVARSEGIGAAMLPDFLGLEANQSIALLGQDELASEDLGATVGLRLGQLVGKMGGATEEVTVRLLVASARVGQHRFASKVLAKFGHSCGFCGMHPGTGLERRGLLVASHIKPWRESTSRERLDPANGIAACPTHDTAFDGGLLWVNGGYLIHLADELVAANRADPRIGASLGQPPISERLLVPAGSDPPDPRYLRWHQENVAAA